MTQAISSSIGVLAAPGVRVTRFEPRQSIESGVLGIVGYVGILEKGPIEDGDNIGQLIGPIDHPTMFEKICGGRIVESDFPRVCQDYFSHGGTRMYLVRVADGTQEFASINFRNRKDSTINGMDNRCITIKAHNPGRWGGKKRVRFGKVYFSTAVSGSSFATGYEDPQDAWKGGTLYATLSGENASWLVEANSSAGVVSTSSDKSFLDDLSVDTGWDSHGYTDTTRYTALLALVALAGGALLADVITRVNLLRTYYNAHCAATGYVHKTADIVNTVSSDVATDQDSVNTLLNELKGDFNAHVLSTTYHNAASSLAIASPDADGLATSITLANEILTDLLNHVDDYAYVTWYVDVSASSKRLSVEIMDGSRNFNDDFGIVVYLDGDSVYSKLDLSMDPSSGRYFVSVVNNDALNHYIKITDNWSGEYASDSRPANFWGYTSYMSATRIDVWPIDYFITSPGEADGNVGGFDFKDSMIRDRLVLTFTSPTAFSVESESFGDLEAGAVGTLYTTHSVYGLSFMVNAGDTAFSIDDTITIDVEPFEIENSTLARNRVYTNTSSYPRVYCSIKSNTRTSIIGKLSEDFTTVGTAPTYPSVTGSIAGSGVTYTFNTVGNTDLKLISDRGEEQEIAVTSGAEVTLETIISDINDSITGVTASAGTGADAGKLVITGDRGGKYAFLEITDGGLNSIVGFTDDTEYSASSNGSPIRIQGPYDLLGGSNGSAGVTSDMMIEAFDPIAGDNGSPFNQIEDNALVKLAAPTWYDTDVQNAVREYARIYHHQCRIEIPPTVFSEDDAVEWIDSTFGRDYGEYCKTAFPSYAYIPDPDGESGTRLYACLTGMYHGREASISRNRNGYHKAEAGIEFDLPDIISLGDVLDERPVNRNLDLEFLNPKGVNGLKRIRGKYHMWGARTISTSSLWKFAHQAEQMAHYEHVLLGQFDWAVFELNDETLWEAIWSYLDDYFRAEYRKGALRGATQEEAYSIRCDDITNSTDSIDEGIVQAEVELRLAGVAEIVIIGISRKGINTTVK